MDGLSLVQSFHPGLITRESKSKFIQVEIARLALRREYLFLLTFSSISRTILIEK